MDIYVAGYECQVCSEQALQPIAEFEQLPRITSDCQPFPPGGKLTVCGICGTVQKIPDKDWLQDIGHIYQNYQVYGLADGEEQIVLDPATGEPQKRSLVLMRQLRETRALPASIQALDVGCGNGVTLRAMSAFFPEWKLYGNELDASNLARLEKIAGFQQFFAGALNEIPQMFDFVSMVHSLEHFTQPLQALKDLRKRVRDSGFLFVEVCNVEENPFDILVADHLMHFSPASLARIARRAGFDSLRLETGWVKKEVSFLASAVDQMGTHIAGDPAGILESVWKNVVWLRHLIEKAKKAAATSGGIGLFGTSIAASWLATELGDRVKFFVDEDTNRVGRSYMGKPVFLPSDVPESSLVYLALAPTLAASISERLGNYRWISIAPPAL